MCPDLLRCCKSKRSSQTIVMGVETCTGNGESEGIVEELILFYLQFFPPVTEGVVVYVEKFCCFAFIPSGHLVSFFNVEFL